MESHPLIQLNKNHEKIKGEKPFYEVRKQKDKFISRRKKWEMS